MSSLHIAHQPTSIFEDTYLQRLSVFCSLVNWWFGRLVVWIVSGSPKMKGKRKLLFLGPPKKIPHHHQPPPKTQQFTKSWSWNHPIIHHLTLRSCSHKSHSTFYLTARHLAQWEPWEPSKPWFWWTFSGGGTRCPRKWSTSQGTGWAADGGLLYLDKFLTFMK